MGQAVGAVPHQPFYQRLVSWTNFHLHHEFTGRIYRHRIPTLFGFAAHVAVAFVHFEHINIQLLSRLLMELLGMVAYFPEQPSYRISMGSRQASCALERRPLS